MPRRHKVLTHGQEHLSRKVTSVSIHSFFQWLDTFSYVLRPADVTVKEVNHIMCFSIDIAKDLILLSCRLWNTCACCNWRQHLKRLSPHGLHWPTVDESLDTAALTSVSLRLLGRRNTVNFIDGWILLACSKNSTSSLSLCIHFMSTSSINRNHERGCLSDKRSNRSSTSPIKMLV